MGGNALKAAAGFEARRVVAAEYVRLVEDLMAQLRHLTGARMALVPSYRSKPDFGDVDILVEGERIEPELSQAIERTLKPVVMVRNGPVLSFDFQQVQIDLIATPTRHFDFSLQYFAYNDLGNLIGRIAHRMGFKFGHAGLHYLLRDPQCDTRLIQEICIEQGDFARVLVFVGLDPERHARGFETLEEIFQYVTTSPYFQPDAYALENRNHTARVRDRKRASYRAFLEWMEQHPNLPMRERLPQEKALARAEHFFPAFAAQLHAARAKDQREQALREAFSGARISAALGISGKVLGQVMRAIAASFDDRGAFERFLLETPHDELESMLIARGRRAVEEIENPAEVGGVVSRMD